MRINNLPEYAREYSYIVATADGEDLWFWGAYKTAASADRAADEIDGIVITSNSIIWA